MADGSTPTTPPTCDDCCTGNGCDCEPSLLHDPARLARRFHELYEELAPTFGYETRIESRVAWDDVPQANRQLMIAVCAALIVEDERAALPTVDDHPGYDGDK